MYNNNNNNNNNIVGSLPLAKNAKHSPSNSNIILHACVVCAHSSVEGINNYPTAIAGLMVQSFRRLGIMRYSYYINCAVFL